LDIESVKVNMNSIVEIIVSEKGKSKMFCIKT